MANKKASKIFKLKNHMKEEIISLKKQTKMI